MQNFWLLLGDTDLYLLHSSYLICLIRYNDKKIKRAPLRIAIVRLSALGDIINSALILQFIKQAHPDARIEWICEEAFAPIIQGHPALDAVHTVAIKRAKRTKSLSLLFQSISMLRSLGTFDVIIDLQGLLKSAIVARLIGKNIYGFDKESIREPLASKLYQSHAHIPYAENSIWRSVVLVNTALGLHITKEMVDAKQPALFYKEEDNITQNLLHHERKNIAFSCNNAEHFPTNSIRSLTRFGRRVIGQYICVGHTGK